MQKYKALGLGCRLDRFAQERVRSQTRDQLRQSLKLSKENFVFIFVGRQVHFKGFALAVRAFLSFYSQYPEARLLLVGTRDPQHSSGLRPEEERIIATHPGVISAGWREDVECYLAISHVNLFPSEREGMPVNVMESLAMGVPVITIDDMAEILSRGERILVRFFIEGRQLKAGRR
jgi:glycosyltransferase involved in cell wall biosynthesis